MYKSRRLVENLTSIRKISFQFIVIDFPMTIKESRITPGPFIDNFVSHSFNNFEIFRTLTNQVYTLKLVTSILIISFFSKIWLKTQHLPCIILESYILWLFMFINQYIILTILTKAATNYNKVVNSPQIYHHQSNAYQQKDGYIFLSECYRYHLFCHRFDQVKP